MHGRVSLWRGFARLPDDLVSADVPWIDAGPSLGMIVPIRRFTTVYSWSAQHDHFRPARTSSCATEPRPTVGQAL